MRRRVVGLLGLVALLSGTLVLDASAIPGSRRQQERQYGIDDTNAALDAADDQQHESPDGHLPGRVKNVERLSRLRLTNLEGGIADVAYFKGFAYVNGWHPNCPNAGTYVVDVRRPRFPKQVAFLPAGAHDYTTEGAHGFTMNTPNFKGDVFVVSHESCDVEGMGGISLWDVTDPTDPWPLIRHFGDDTLSDGPWQHDSHSAMGWSVGNKSYVVAVDNLGLTEAAFALGGDVDIFDVTDPGEPVQIADFALTFSDGMLNPAQDNLANGANPNHHDMWVRKVDRDGDGDKEWTLMLSYWDAGWIMLDVSDPANPAYVDDSDYTAEDPEAAHLPDAPLTPEGNAHQGEWNYNGRWWIGTDEDFGPYRALITTDDGGTYDGGQFSWTPPLNEHFEDGQMNGPTVYGGEACTPGADANATPTDPDDDGIPDAADYTAEEGEEKILVVARGICFFSIKVHNAQLNGWDAVVVGQNHAGSNGGLAPDGYLCGSQGHEFTPEIPGLCTGHRALHEIFDDAVEYSAGDLPSPGTAGDGLADMGIEGDVITGRADIFDGWGYVHLLNRQLNHVATYAPPRVHDENCASGCGIMSVHEVATDKRSKNLAYFAWYGLGLRVASFNKDGFTERGYYMDVGGNDFWGIEVVHQGPDRRPVLLASDRDSGLWIFKYTGAEP